MSLNQLHEQSRRFGAGLVDKWGWQRGDVLCVFSLNQVDTGVVMFGTHYALGVGIPPVSCAFPLGFVVRLGGCCRAVCSGTDVRK